MKRNKKVAAELCFTSDEVPTIANFIEFLINAGHVHARDRDRYKRLVTGLRSYYRDHQFGRI